MPVLNHPDGSPVSAANPLPIIGDLNISSQIEIKNDVGNPVPVSGTVALDAATLAALESTTTSVSNFPATQVVSGSVNISNTPTVTVSNLPATQVVSGSVDVTGTVNTAITGTGASVANPLYANPVLGGVTVSQSNPIPIMPVASNQLVAGTTAAAAGATITLPAGSAGTSHYIDCIDLVLFTSTARTGTATPVTVSSTNLNGWGTLLSSAGTLGSTINYQFGAARPIKSGSTATNSVITLPAVTGGIWRYNITYSTAV